MNTIIVAGSMALIAAIGYYYFKYLDRKAERNTPSE